MMDLLRLLTGQQQGGLSGMLGGTAQPPGSSAQQPGMFQRLLSPDMAAPLLGMAGGLMGNQGNMQNVGQGFANMAPLLVLQQNKREAQAQTSKTLEYLRTQAPDIAAAVESGAMPAGDGWKAYLDRKNQKPDNPYMSAGGDIYNKDTGEWIDNPSPQYGSMPTSIQEYERAQQDPNYADWIKNNKGRDNSLTTVDKKAIFEAEDVLPAVDGTLSALSRAKELNDKTYTGMTAGVRGWAGANVPGAGMLLDEEKSRATLEFNNLMTYESIKTMADTLKGATTDFELNKFVEILADPATPPDIRGRTIDRMMQLAQRKKQIAEDRVNKLRGGDYYDAPGSAPAAPGPQQRLRFNPQTGDFE
jgi:hypothetical protein